MALIDCPECGKQVSDQAVACPHCGMPLKPMAAPAQPPPMLPPRPVVAPPAQPVRKHSGCLVILLGMVAVGIVVTCARTLSGGGGSPSASTSAAAKPAASPQPSKSAAQMLADANDATLSAEARKGRAERVLQAHPGTDEAKQALALVGEMNRKIAAENIGKQWRYVSREDGMTGKAERNAFVTSSNSFQFGFPYQGAQHAILQVRKHPRYGSDVIFQIENGQILCSSYSCPVRIRFDEAAPRTYTGNEPADNSSTYVFIPGFADITRRMAHAKRMRVEVNIFQEGALQAEFDVEGFDMKKLDGK